MKKKRFVRDFSQAVSTTTINNYIRSLKAFFTWYADTGMRLGECLQVTTDDLDMDDRTICLPAENTKSRRTRHPEPFDATLKMLKKYAKTGGFTEKYFPLSFYDQL